MSIATFLASFSGIYYVLYGKTKLKSFLTNVNTDICNLKVFFKKNISLNRQRRFVNYSFFMLSLYCAAFFIQVLILGDYKNLGILRSIHYILCCVAAGFLLLWLWAFSLMELVLRSILANLMEAMMQVKDKFQPQFSKICLHIYVQWNLLNKIFHVVLLAVLIDNFGYILLTIWSTSEPKASCVMGDYQYMLIICFLVNIIIIESGERVKRKVRNIWISNIDYFYDCPRTI